MVRKQNFQSKGVRLGLAPWSAPEDGNSVSQDNKNRRARATQSEKDITSRSPVSRGYIKLSDAAKAFHFDFRGKTVLDIGSSTGGFTKYALDHGAKKVIAVEKGTNQMMKSLRLNSRIELHEKTDIFAVSLSVKTLTSNKDNQITKAAIILKNTPDIILADVSFISLTKILVHAKKHLSAPNTEFLVMLKPQFEARPSELQNGIVKNDKMRREIIKNFEFWLQNNGFIINGKHDNELVGKHGNRERFYHLSLAK